MRIIDGKVVDDEPGVIDMHETSPGKFEPIKTEVDPTTIEYARIAVSTGETISLELQKKIARLAYEGIEEELMKMMARP